MFEAKLDGVLHGLLTDAVGRCSSIDLSVEFTPNLPLSDLPHGLSNSRSLVALTGMTAER